MNRLTAPRLALLASTAGLAAEAASPSSLIAFYVVAVAAAGLIGSAFLAYLANVDAPSPRSLAALASVGLAGALVMAEAALRFPMMLSPSQGPGALVVAAVVLCLLALLTEAPLPERVPRPDVSALRGLLSR